MITPIPINLAVEDSLSEAVLRKLLQSSNRKYAIGYCYSRGGYGYLKQGLPGFNNAAKGTPFIVLADLEANCAPNQVLKWLPVPIHHNLLFRIAVKEIESWVLADRRGIASFLGIREVLIPNEVDKINDPKKFLIDLARKSRKRELRESIVPFPNTTARIGPDYNGQLTSFVDRAWNIREAVNNSESLSRAVNAINTFIPE